MEFTAEMIAGLLDGTVVGDKNAKVHTVGSIDGGRCGALAYLTNPKYEQYVYTSEASVILVDKTFEPKQPVRATLIKVADVGACVLSLLEMYNAARPRKRAYRPSRRSTLRPRWAKSVTWASLPSSRRAHASAANARYTPQCYIGDGVEIGEGTRIYPGVKIYEGCRARPQLHHTLGRSDRCRRFRLRTQARRNIRQDSAAGQRRNRRRRGDRSQHLHRPRQDRGDDHTSRRQKLDNLIQVGHNVEIGANTVSSAQMGIAGTSKIGANCFVAGQVGIADHVNIGDRVRIGSKTGIDKDVPDGEMRFGYPRASGHAVSSLVRRVPTPARAGKQGARTGKEVVAEVAAA